MNKSIIYSILLAVAFLACDPIEDRQSIGNPITADQLDITATPIVVNGKKSNKIILENKSPVLSLWDYGMGVSNRAQDEVLLVLTGESDIVFTGLNPDGTNIMKTLKVNVEELSFKVPAEWAVLCGEGSKDWVWDNTQPADNSGPVVWGNGGYLGNTSPGWWKVGLQDIEGQAPGEGVGASMTFSTKGAKLTKTKADGSSSVGSFSFDMGKQTKDDAGNIWAKGKLYTKNTAVLCGTVGGEIAYEYDILMLNEDKMVISYRVPTELGTAYFWMFKAK